MAKSTNKTAAKSTSKKSSVSKAKAKPVAKAAIEEVETPVVTEELGSKNRRTKEEIFQDSLNKVKSTGNEQVDAIARKVIAKIHSNELTMEPTENGFVGEMSNVDINIERVEKGKTARYVLTIGDISIGGQFAAKCYRVCNAQNKPAASIPSFDTEKVAAVASLLDL